MATERRGEEQRIGRQLDERLGVNSGGDGHEAQDCEGDSLARVMIGEGALPGS